MSTTDKKREQSVEVRVSTMIEIRARSGSEWATVRYQEPRGDVCIMSDFGNWSYSGWCAIGDQGMAAFLARIDSSYAGGKMLGLSIQVHDVDGSIRELKRAIVDRRKGIDWDKESARAEWDLVSLYEENPGAWCLETRFDPCDIGVTMMNPSWRNFWDRLWVPMIKPELGRLASEQEGA